MVKLALLDQLGKVLHRFFDRHFRIDPSRLKEIDFLRASQCEVHVVDALPEVVQAG